MTDMRDALVPLSRRIELAIERISKGQAPMRVPVEATDPDVVLSDCAKRIAELEAERDAIMAAIATAYGNLWHVNNEPYAPIPIYTPEKAAYAARKVLRDLLTSEQRGDAINATQHVWGSSDLAAKGGE